MDNDDDIRNHIRTATVDIRTDQQDPELARYRHHYAALRRYRELIAAEAENKDASLI
jgi:hypothetical protein